MFTLKVYTWVSVDIGRLKRVCLLTVHGLPDVKKATERWNLFRELNKNFPEGSMCAVVINEIQL